jgi:hypothetical protein
MTAAELKAKLDAAGIKTLTDIDAWIRKNPRVVANGPYKGQRYLMSRYEALTEIVGENAATMMLNELAIRQCCGRKQCR